MEKNYYEVVVVFEMEVEVNEKMKIKKVKQRFLIKSENVENASKLAIEKYETGMDFKVISCKEKKYDGILLDAKTNLNDSYNME